MQCLCIVYTVHCVHFRNDREEDPNAVTTLLKLKSIQQQTQDFKHEINREHNIHEGQHQTRNMRNTGVYIHKW